MNKAHQGRGYYQSFLGSGSYIAYHFMVGKDGTVKQLRSLNERTGHTKSQPVNLESIAIVLNGNFEHEYPTSAQMKALKHLISRLDRTYKFERISVHKEASSTACPGKNLLAVLQDWNLLREQKFPPLFNVTRYYTPVAGQLRYYKGADGVKSFQADFEVNCHGDCFSTADETDLHHAEPMTVAACPPEYPFGTKFYIEGMDITVTCHDHGGAINGNKLDVWSGIGQVGLMNILTTRGGQRFVREVK